MAGRIAVVIPCYRVRAHILDVLNQIGPEVSSIFCVDDACPDGSGEFIQTECRDRRVRVLRHDENGGVGEKPRRLLKGKPPVPFHDI